MLSFKSGVVSLLALATLSACTTTSSEVRRPANSSDTARVAESNLATVSDIVDASGAYSVKSEQAKDYEVDPTGNNEKLVVQMGADFNRKYLLCDIPDKCEPVKPIVTQTSNSISTGDKTDARDTVISDVKLSENTLSLFGKNLTTSASPKKILIMQPDVELYELGVALQEPNAFWTKIANNYVTEISAQYFQKLGYDVSLYKDKANGVSEKTGQDLISLHEDVGISILNFQQNAMLQLPTLQSGKFDWHLGKTTQELASGYGADYGLFIYLRDQYSSGSRVAAQIMMAVLFGAHVQGGTQVGFASLVNLKTGEVEWFNRIVSTSGDLRTFPAAVNATDALYEDIPL
ncbi:hypothetical protein [Sneathiella limimaris]|uniref:hypothetical protein n=1 Tax=Sneathiella limimaris TaxID=1964213 RepID=UPI00146D4268|nr:hypothetical protein [Sneathiella limimaris]